MKKKALCWLLLFTLVFSSLITVQAEDVSSQSDNSNVMMVLDGSGSLTNEGGTDVNGLRYDAVNLFLNLLPDSGSTVGSIVFDDSKTMPLNTGMVNLNGSEDKRVLFDKIKNTKAGGDTDIGNALQTALTELTKNASSSDESNCILLFSDGETYLTDKNAEKASLEKKNDAVKTAKKLGIPIHCVCLNTNNSANTSEVKKIAEATDGIYMEINSADDLTNVFEKFYSLIYNEPGIPEDDKTDEDGNFSKKFQVPTIGVAEVNIVIRTQSNNAKISLVRPSGIQMSDSEVSAISTKGSNYQLIKLVNPDAGVWELQIKGDPNAKLSLNWIYNTQLGADIECSVDPNNIPLNSSVQIKGYLLDNGSRVTDESSYNEYSATLVMTNAATGTENTLAMTADGASFTADATLNEYGTYYASLKLTCDKIERSSQSIVLNVGNTAPVASPSTVKENIKLLPFSSGKVEFNLNDYITDAEDAALTYTLGNYTYSNDAVTLTDNTLSIDAKDAKSGTVVVSAADSQGASCEVTFEVSTTNLTFLFILIPVLIIAIILIILLMKKNKESSTVCSYTITIESFDNETGHSSLPIAQDGFKGKKPLTHWQVGDCGITGEFHAIPVKGQKFGKCEFVSKQKFETEASIITDKIAVNPGDDFRLYAVSATEEGRQQKGIHIMVDFTPDFF